MKLIQTSTGYVNADMIESFNVVTHEHFCEIVAYSRRHGGDYILGKCESKDYDENADAVEAFARLDDLAKWLIGGEDGIFDIMHIWESDEK